MNEWGQKEARVIKNTQTILKKNEQNMERWKERHFKGKLGHEFNQHQGGPGRWDFSGGPVAKTVTSQCRGPLGSIPGHEAGDRWVPC